MNYSVFASESVSAGHPDKICDQISDAIVDAALKADPRSRVAVETAVKNKVLIFGEITCSQKLPYKKIARQVIKDLGYTRPEWGFSYRSPIEINVCRQSPDIALGVDNLGAGDQGMMFGYAVNETPQLMPLPITLAHTLVQKMDQLRETKKLSYLRPDGKCEFTVKYQKGKPISVEKIVIAVPHDPKVEKEQVKKDLYQKAVLPLLKKYKLPKVSLNQVILNGTGKWEIGGPASDSGLTGRKIIVDSYGGMARVGGGAFSGKDVTKVDRSAAYGTRFIAKNIVAAGLADRCEVQVAYVIGHPEPIAKAVETFGTAKKSQKVIEDYAWSLLDMSVAGIINSLKLKRPIYRQTARYGHFGHQKYPWEKIRT